MVILASLLAALPLNPEVSPATLAATICAARWTEGIRPRSSYVAALERAQLPRGADPTAYVMDHVMPLSLGGHPSAATNLRPQLIADAKRKDLDERRLSRAVCAGRMTLGDAQAEMMRLWP